MAKPELPPMAKVPMALPFLPPPRRFMIFAPSGWKIEEPTPAKVAQTSKLS